MAYNKRNNSERLPKLEYFQVRLKDAVRDGNQDKADYYRSRIAELKAQSNDERISLKVEGLFGSRKTITEAFEYADLIAKSSESPIHVFFYLR